MNKVLLLKILKYCSKKFNRNNNIEFSQGWQYAYLLQVFNHSIHPSPSLLPFVLLLIGLLPITIFGILVFSNLSICFRHLILCAQLLVTSSSPALFRFDTSINSPQDFPLPQLQFLFIRFFQHPCLYIFSLQLYLKQTSTSSVILTCCIFDSLSVFLLLSLGLPIFFDFNPDILLGAALHFLEYHRLSHTKFFVRLSSSQIFQPPRLFFLLFFTVCSFVASL